MAGFLWILLDLPYGESQRIYYLFIYYYLNNPIAILPHLWYNNNRQLPYYFERDDSE